MNNHKRAFGHDGKHDNLIIVAAANDKKTDKNASKKIKYKPKK